MFVSFFEEASLAQSPSLTRNPWSLRKVNVSFGISVRFQFSDIEVKDSNQPSALPLATDVHTPSLSLCLPAMKEKEFLHGADLDLLLYFIIYALIIPFTWCLTAFATGNLLLSLCNQQMPSRTCFVKLCKYPFLGCDRVP